MDHATSNPLFRLDPDRQVMVSLAGRSYVLGPCDEVCPMMEAFLVQLSHEFEPRFGGLTLVEWDSRWTPEGRLDQDFSRFRGEVGLYKAILDGEVKYIGKATEYANGGLRKRLHDYVRLSSSARTSEAGRMMHKHRFELAIEIAVTGSDRAGSQIATCLEDLFIERYDPPWNNFGRSKKAARLKLPG